MPHVCQSGWNRNANRDAATNEVERFYALNRAAKNALRDGNVAKAETLANELAQLAPKYTNDWNYGNVALAFLTINVSAGDVSQVNDPSKTSYGEISPDVPKELRAFAFLVGKWEGKGKTRLENGTFAEYPVTWIGRYILNGTAIADEVHAPAPDGSPYLGVSLRQYDRISKTWIIEFLNVTGSFIRKQVNPGSGSVAVTEREVLVASESPGMKIREHYLVPDHTHFTYRLDVSRDGGKTWSEGPIEMTFLRQE